MIKLYADLVEAGRRSLDGTDGVIRVPDKYLADVIIELEKRGYFKVEEPEEEETIEEIDPDFTLKKEEEDNETSENTNEVFSEEII